MIAYDWTLHIEDMYSWDPTALALASIYTESEQIPQETLLKMVLP